MAPEHFRGRAVFQSDIWSLGITCYEMLTGTVPFYDADPLKIAQAFTSQQIVPPHLKNPAVPKALSEAVMRALTVNLGDRYLSAQQMLEALKKLRDGVAKETRPLGHAVSGSFGSGSMPMQRPAAMAHTQQRMCKFCFKPLPRMAVACPSCGEKN
jgi:serine/threonine-protein kinase